MNRLAARVVLWFVALGVLAPALGVEERRAAAGGDDLAKGRALSRSKDFHERVEGVKLLIAADAPGSIQPLEDVIRQATVDMARIAKLLDDLDMRYMEAESFWANARASGDARTFNLAKHRLKLVQNEWNAVAKEMIFHQSIAVAAGSGFARLTSPGAIERIEAGVRGESDPWTRQFYALGVARKGCERAVPALVALARSADPLARATALRGLRPFVGEPGVFELTKTATEDKAWSIRLAAYAAIARAPSDVAIPFLVAAVQREKGEIALAIDAMLDSLTGQSFQDEPKGWSVWWKDHEKAVLDGTFEPDERHDATRGDQGTFDSFFRIPVESLNVLFTIDYSSSMEAELTRDDARADAVRTAYKLPATRLGWAQAETIRALKSLPVEARFNLVVYSDRVKRFSDKSQFATDSNKRNAISWLLNQPTGWLTNIYDALKTSFGDVHGKTGTGAWFADLPDTIFFLTDGTPTRGRFQDDASLARLLRQWNAVVGACIHTVGIGDEHDAELLATLAETTGGLYIDLQTGKIEMARARPGVPAEERRASIAQDLVDAVERLKSTTPADRVSALNDLRAIRIWKPVVLDTLLEHLSDEDANVRHSLAGVVASCGRDAIEPLRAIVAEPDRFTDRVVATALDALERIGGLAQVVLPHMVAMVEKPDGPFRVAAARVLGALGAYSMSVRGSIEKAIATSSDPEEKAALAAALARIPKK